MSFKWNSGDKPLAIVNGGKEHKGDFLWIKDAPPEDEDMMSEEEELKQALNRKSQGSAKKKIDYIKEAEAKIKAKKELFKGSGKERLSKVKLKDGSFRLVPNKKTRDILYICAPSGSGKSTLASSYATNFRKMFPDQPILLFSRVAEDKVLDKLKGLIRVDLDESYLMDPLNADNIPVGSLCIFDDIDTLETPLLKCIQYLVKDLAEVARHRNVYMVVTSHLINRGRDSRVILNECTCLCVFPASGTAHQINYCLKNYLGYHPKVIKRILRTPSRWVACFKNTPQCILGEHVAYTMNYLEKLDMD